MSVNNVYIAIIYCLSFINICLLIVIPYKTFLAICGYKAFRHLVAN